MKFSFRWMVLEKCKAEFAHLLGSLFTVYSNNKFPLWVDQNFYKAHHWIPNNRIWIEFLGAKWTYFNCKNNVIIKSFVIELFYKITLFLIGQSEVHATSGAISGRPLFFFFLLLFLIPLFKNPEGVVVGFRNFAWAPKKQKY